MLPFPYPMNAVPRDADVEDAAKSAPRELYLYMVDYEDRPALAKLVSSALEQVSLLGNTLRSSLKVLAVYEKIDAGGLGVGQHVSTLRRRDGGLVPYCICFDGIPMAMPIRGETPNRYRRVPDSHAIRFTLGYYTRQGFHIPSESYIDLYANVDYSLESVAIPA